MSGFCGFVIKDDDPDLLRSARLHSVLRTISRNAGDAVHQVESRGAGAAAFTTKAFRQIDQVEQKGTWLTTVCGDPIWVDNNEDRPDNDSRNVIDALIIGSSSQFRLASGSFSALAFDALRGVARIVVDMVGVRPVYYYDSPSLFAFATCRRVIKALLEDQAAVDPLALTELVATRRLTGSTTIIEKVRLLRGGEWLKFDGATLKVETYFDMRLLPINDAGFDDAVNAVHNAFRRAVTRRLSRAPGRQEAMLSGGLDSRLIAATLREMGAELGTFAVAKPNSADAILSPLAAAAIGSKHTLAEIPNGERVRALPFFAYAAALWPRSDASDGRAIWAGDGGSGVLGHTNISLALIAAAAKGGDEFIQTLYPNLSRQTSRILTRRRRSDLYHNVSSKISGEIYEYGLTILERTAFYFDLRNHQFRHLHDYFEDIDIWRIEPILPFFDRDFVVLVHQTPIKYFVGHRLYHSLMTRLQIHSHRVPWQTYRSQDPCPFPMPENVMDQWSLASTFHKEPAVNYAEWFERLANLKLQNLRRELNVNYLTIMRVGSRLGLIRNPHASRLAFRIVSQAGEAPCPQLEPAIISTIRLIDFPSQ